MTTAGVTVSVSLQNEDYEKVKRAVRDDGSVGLKDGQAVSSTHIRMYINKLVKNTIDEYGREDPLEDADVDVDSLTESQKEALAEELGR